MARHVICPRRELTTSTLINGHSMNPSPSDSILHIDLWKSQPSLEKLITVVDD